MNSKTKVVLTSAAFATFMSLGANANTLSKRYIVQMRSPGAFATAQMDLLQSLRNGRTHMNALGRISVDRPRLLNTGAEISDALDNLNMLVVESSNPSDIKALEANPNVAYVEQEIFYQLSAVRPTPTDAVPVDDEAPWGIKTVKAPEAWTASTLDVNSTSGLMGAGARVAILDTGIDKDHPDLRLRFETGKNFVNHVAATPTPSSNLFLTGLNQVLDMNAGTPPYEFFDEEGHGTHVAGTIAGEFDGKGVVGVAPKARVLSAKVCGKFGCSSISIVNATNWAITQKVDVISMSLGGPMNSQAQEDALNAAEQAGIVNIAASGNSGTNSVSYPAAYASCLAIGAIDMTLKRASFSQWGPELGIMAPGVDVKSSVPQGTGRDSKVQITINGALQDVPSTSFVGSPESTTPLTGNLMFAGLGKPEDFAGRNFQGKIALIQRGEIPFADKVKAAIGAGAMAVIVYNNTAGLISGALTQDGSLVAIPVTMIEQSNGELLKSGLDAGQAQQAKIATLRTDYAAFSGTSMATPHVSGVAALVKAVNHNLTPAQVRQILKSTATPIGGQTAENEYGSGLVNAQAAVAAALKASN